MSMICLNIATYRQMLAGLSDSPGNSGNPGNSENPNIPTKMSEMEFPDTNISTKRRNFAKFRLSYQMLPGLSEPTGYPDIPKFRNHSAPAKMAAKGFTGTNISAISTILLILSVLSDVSSCFRIHRDFQNPEIPTSPRRWPRRDSPIPASQRCVEIG